MKKVLINGQLIEFSRFNRTQTLTEEINPNFIGYSNIYYVDGIEFKLDKPIKFYK